MAGCCLKCLSLLLHVVFIVSGSYFGTGTATRSHHRKSSRHPVTKPSASPPAPHAARFNVIHFGAKGDGLTDDTKAFEAAWGAACEREGSTVVVPSRHEFLVGPVSFAGPCEPNIVFQLNGTVVAPTSPKPWGSGALQWLEFTKIARGVRIQGHGVIDGNGVAWWAKSENHPQIDKMPHTRPAALRFYGSYNVTVTGITIRNSPKCHLKFDDCEAVQVDRVSISSPGDSPNTDGIHLQNSVDVSIRNTDLSCGDDCISIQTGCSNVYVCDVRCGPGHGISIGGLGQDRTKACVSNVTVEDVAISNALTGVRIKTWQGGSGSVRNVMFANVQMSEVETPINIDQFYCDGGGCKNQSSAVAVSGVRYKNIKGTYTVRPVYLACSDSTPCHDISLADIELKPAQRSSRTYDPFCWDAYGTLQSPTVPPIACLKTKKTTIDDVNQLITENSC